jgi:hypothetical protein
VATTKEVAMIEQKEISRQDIAQRAYELYVQRGGEPGYDVQDWVRAEKELGAGTVATPAKRKAAQADDIN